MGLSICSQTDTYSLTGLDSPNGALRIFELLLGLGLFQMVFLRHVAFVVPTLHQIRGYIEEDTRNTDETTLRICSMSS